MSTIGQSFTVVKLGFAKPKFENVCAGAFHVR
jgi:hypothetical protein